MRMISSLRTQSSSIGNDDESFGDDDSGIQLHDTLKLSVLYYKKHSKSAVPIPGRLRLGQKNLSFRGKGIDYTWDVDSIRVEKFKGRVQPGIKVLGKRRAGGGGEDGKEEFIFTNVNQRSFNSICRSIDGAKFDSEMERVWRSSTHAVAKNGPNLSKMLSFQDDHDKAVVPKRLLKPSLLLKPFRLIYLVISFLHKMLTGRRLWGPTNVNDASLQVLEKVNPILTVSKNTLSEKQQIAIKRDVEAIHRALSKIRLIVRQQHSAYTSRGSVVEINMDKPTHVLETFRSISTSISLAAFSIMKATNMPMIFRTDIMYPFQNPSTVGKAVQNTNDKLEALMELVVMDKSLGDMANEQIIGEAMLIQALLYNIKVHSTLESTSSASKEE